MGKSSETKKAQDKKSHLNLDRTLQQIERVYGKGAIMHLDGDFAAYKDAISTGTLSLDMALGGYGLPRGRIVEIFGPESSGKTTLALNVIAAAQKADGVAAFIDVEHALDPAWMKRCGVNPESLLVSQPDGGEQALEITDMLVRSNAVDVIVIDSVAALISKDELEGSMAQMQVGTQARLMSKAMRKLTAAISKSRCVVIFINQIRMKIGVMFGNPETTPGGRALKFYSSVRIDIRRIASIKDGDQVSGSQIRARVVKNKVAPPFRDAQFDIMFDCGISKTGDLLDLGVKYNIVEKQGSWLRYGEVQLGQGRENAKRYLDDNPELFAEIRGKILKISGYSEDGNSTVSGDNQTASKKNSSQSKKDIGVSKSAPIAQLKKKSAATSAKTKTAKA